MLLHSLEGRKKFAENSSWPEKCNVHNTKEYRQQSRNSEWLERLTYGCWFQVFIRINCMQFGL